MPLCFKPPTLSSNHSHRLLYRALLVLLTLSLLAVATPAQSDPATKQAEVEKLIIEGMQLYREGSKESLEQAIQKFEEALKFFESVNDASGKALMLANIGVIYSSLGEKRKALDYLSQALTLFRMVGDKEGEATALNNIGSVYDDLGEQQQALTHFEQALLLVRASGNRQREAGTLNNIGKLYSSLGEKQKALDYFAQALLLRKATEDRRGEAVTLYSIGRVYASLGEQQKAQSYYTQALTLYRAVGDRDGEADTLHNIGLIYKYSGENQKALEYYERALPLYQVVGDREGEANTLNSIGRLYDELGEKQKALKHYEQALHLARSVNSREGEATVLNNIGRIYDSSGEKQKALEYYEQALSLYRAIRDREGEATTLNNFALTYNDLGEKQKALDYLEQALLIDRATSDRQGEATTLNNIGLVYKSLGEQQKALDHYERALLLKRAVGDRQSEAITLINIGAVYASLGEQQKALNYYERALPLTRAIGDRGSESTALNNIGGAYIALNEQRKAIDHYEQALPLIRATGNRQHEATTLNNIGGSYVELGEQQKALTYVTQALHLYRAIGYRQGEAMALYNTARVESSQGKLIEARHNTQAAIDIIESLRTKITNQELRASYFATFQDYYRFYIGLLMLLHKQSPAAGYDGEALQTAERARARALLELLAEANADIRQGVDPALVEREHSLQQRLNAKAQKQLQLLSGSHTKEQAAALAGEIEALTTEYQQVQTQIKQASPRYAALTQPQPLTFKEMQTQVLDTDTLLLEYSLGTSKSYLWAVTPDSIKSYELPKRSEIEAAARSVYGLLNARNQELAGETVAQRRTRIAQADAQYPAAAARLSQMVLGPVVAQLGNKRLLVVSDGALQYIPFAALPEPNTTPNAVAAAPLVVKHEIISLPSASALAVLRRELKDRKPAAKTVAVLADPVFESDDERVVNPSAQTNVAPKPTPPRRKQRELPLGMERSASESGLTRAGLEIPRLPGTRDEAGQILSLVPPTQRKAAFDFAANRQTATSEELSQYRYVHFATHGFLNSLHPELSGIVLSMVDEKGTPQDGFLRAHEIFNLKLPAELVVLSACQTGLGKEVKGEGLVGLTRGFMYAGASRVVVSLWSVSDDATAELMARFYRGMLKERIRPAAALRAAQMSLMKERGWQAPFYWAAFTLQGEWR
ncbi:MAG TPA: tetratricopeptide repeat protein [Pyrinomonadaceae bacterium]|jgi:CHAT domain-containing protein/Tfp pilus assembly protein PilF